MYTLYNAYFYRVFIKAYFAFLLCIVLNVYIVYNVRYMVYIG